MTTSTPDWDIEGKAKGLAKAALSWAWESIEDGHSLCLDDVEMGWEMCPQSLSAPGEGDLGEEYDSRLRQLQVLALKKARLLAREARARVIALRAEHRREMAALEKELTGRL